MASLQKAEGKDTEWSAKAHGSTAESAEQLQGSIKTSLEDITAAGTGIGALAKQTTHLTELVEQIRRALHHEGHMPDIPPEFATDGLYEKTCSKIVDQATTGDLFIKASQRHPDAPRLSELQREALHAVVELADDPENHVLMELLPGDIQLIDNFHVLHGRTAYEDDRAEGKVRHLKRLWLETTVLASRPPHFMKNVSSHWDERRSASRLRVT